MQKPSLHIAIFGMTGSGKSFFIKNQVLPQLQRFIIYDIEYEYSGFGVVADSIPKLRELSKTHERIVYQPGTGKAEKDIQEVCKFILYHIRGITLVVDEAHTVAKNNAIPKWYKEIITRGRKRGIGTINISQRGQLLDKTIPTQCKQILVFKVIGKDIEYLSGWVGPQIHQLEAQPQYSYLFKDENGTTGFNNA